MSKYKTIDSKLIRQSLEEAIENRLLTNRITRMTLENSQIQKALMSTNKSIIYIKLPKKAQKNNSFFKSHLYESSLKRLKQQKVTILKEDKIPPIGTKRTFQSFQEEVLRKAKQKIQEKKDYFPHVFTPRPQQTKNSHINQLKTHQKIEQEQQEPKQANDGDSKHKRTSTFQIDGTALGFKNLKQKYLELKQLPVNSKRKSELLQKHENKREQFQEKFSQYQTKFKMQKQIWEHMNRYNRKDFFQTKVNGFKTILYPSNQSHSHAKNDYSIKNRKRDYLSYDNPQKKEVSNFIKRKKLRNFVMHDSNQYSQRFLQHQKKDDNQLSKQVIFPKQNPELGEKGEMCTPWQTDFVNFE